MIQSQVILYLKCEIGLILPNLLCEHELGVEGEWVLRAKDKLEGDSLSFSSLLLVNCDDRSMESKVWLEFR